MTKKELEKEAEDNGVEYANSLEYTISKFSDEEGYCWSQVEQAYEKGALDFAEPREKRIEELETRCTELFLQNNEFAERFEKSIKIIKGLLSCCRNYPQENVKKMEQAEQFLQEIKENE